MDVFKFLFCCMSKPLSLDCILKMKDKIFQVAKNEWLAVANGVALQRSFPNYNTAWNAVNTEKKRQAHRRLVPYSETLFVFCNWTCQTFYLKDSKGFYISTFNDLDVCRAWCESNDYRLSEIYLKTAKLR